MAKSPPSNPTIMVFRPTMEEFKNFPNYITYMESQGAHYAGLAKVIPPGEWKPRTVSPEDYSDKLSFKIRTPVKQTVLGTSGIYTLFNVQSDEIDLREFEKVAKSADYCTPVFTDLDDLERKFWKNVTFSTPIYGADIPGSFYDSDVSTWNMSKLGTILDMIKDDIKVKIEGVNTAYLYFGMWKTIFPWHTEDMELYSINYLHYGASKFWYGIPPSNAHRFERLADTFFPDSLKICPAYLRHKMYMISPLTLKKYSIPFNKIEQKPGEFMITFPYCYHAGFNTGYNCAESTNFASIRWIEFGKNAKLCTCKPDSVRIYMDPFVKRFQTPEEYEKFINSRAHMSAFALDYCSNTANDGEICAGKLHYKSKNIVSRRNPLFSNHKKQNRKRLSSKDSNLKSVKASKSLPLIDENENDKEISMDYPSPCLRTTFEFDDLPSHQITNKYVGDDEECGLGTSHDNQSCKSNHLSSVIDDVVRSASCNVRSKFEHEGYDSKPTNVAAAAGSHGKSFPVTDPFDLGSWAESLGDLWQFKLFNPQREKDFNAQRALKEPHCCLCQYFVSKALTKQTAIIPEKSRKLLTDIFFTKDPLKVNPDGDCFATGFASEDQLLTCQNCKISVHPSCYGVNTASFWYNPKNWKCTRCQLDDSFAECKLCCLRGGALQPTTDRGWCHVICAIMLNGAKFVSFRYKQPIDISPLFTRTVSALPESETPAAGLPIVRVANSSQCMYCQSSGGVTLVCSLGHCNNAFHVTCAYEAGANFERRDWPMMVSAFCTEHNVPSSGSHVPASPRKDYKTGDYVWAKRDDGNFYRGSIVDQTSEIFCVVDFEDGTFSNNLYPIDIEECNCGSCNGAHLSGARVKVRWTDGKVYSAYYRRAYVAAVYHVLLCEEEAVVLVSAEEIIPDSQSTKSVNDEKAEPTYYDKSHRKRVHYW